MPSGASSLLHLLDSCLHGDKFHPFVRTTDCSASLFRLRSATSFRSRVFSSRSFLASWTSDTSIPPYLAFQVQIVCFDTPNSRATCSASRPASTCFSAAMICRLRVPAFRHRSPTPEYGNRTRSSTGNSDLRLNLSHSRPMNHQFRTQHWTAKSISPTACRFERMNY